MNNREIVYLLGAGFNQFLEDVDGSAPPLAKDFFIKAFNKRKYNSTTYLSAITDLLNYIKYYWHLDLSTLKKQELDLEEVFTLIQLKSRKTKGQELQKLIKASFQLEAFFSEFLADYFPMNPKKLDGFNSLLKIGKKLLKQQPTVITFNYDTLLEEGVASASGVAQPPQSYLSLPNSQKTKLPVSLIKYSHHNWNPVLSYGFEFNYVSLPQAGVTQIVKRNEYYGKALNRLYKMNILKLHGSLNWMEVAAPLDKRAWRDENHPSWREYPAYIQKEEGTIYFRGNWHLGMPPLLGTWFLKPKIVTPVLYKDTFYQRSPFPDLWSKALVALKKCKKLIVIGYSFPCTDFSTKMLFLEAFSNNTLEELVVVNPDPAGNVRDTIKKLAHFSKPMYWHKSVKEYINSLGS